MTCFNYKAMPTTNNDYSYHRKAVAFVQSIIWNPYHATSCHWLLIALGWTHRHAHIATQKHAHIQMFTQKQF